VLRAFRLPAAPVVVSTRGLFSAFAAVSATYFAARFWSIVAAGEIFHRIGIDWSLFYAQAMALRSGAGERMYDVDVIDRFLQPLLTYYVGGDAARQGSPVVLEALPVPYPPWFAVAMLPFTLPPPPLGFLLWFSLSLIAIAFLANRVRQFLPDLGWVGSVVAIVAAAPVAWGLYMGQLGVLLAIPVSEMLVSFRSRNEFRAGLWLSVLLLKPQYALLFGLLILWKRRYRAIAGAIVGGGCFVASGLAVAGFQSFLRYPAAVGELSDLRNEIAGPLGMMNWRAIVLAMSPDID
jgi:hypothetical protein